MHLHAREIDANNVRIFAGFFRWTAASHFEGASPFESSPERELVGVLQITPDR